MKASILLIAALTGAQALNVPRNDVFVKRHEGHDDHPMANAAGQSTEATSADGVPGTDMNMNMNEDNMEPSPAAMSHHHGRPVLQDPSLEPHQRKYWEQYSTLTFFSSEQGNKFLLWSHAILVVVAYGLMAPIQVLTSGSSSSQWFYVPFQTVQSGLALLSLFCLALYSATAPKLYPGNSYSKFSVAMAVLESCRWFAVVLRAITNYLSIDNFNGAYMQANDEIPENYHDPNEYPMTNLRETSRRMPSTSSAEFGGASGSETDLSSFSLERSDTIPKPVLNPDDEDAFMAQRRPLPSNFVRKLAENRVFAKLNSALGGFASFFFTLLNYPMFLVSSAYLLTGLATAFLMGKDHYVFALLAHFIKGYVFYILGFMELARFFGAGASHGWSWNEVYVPRESLERPSKLYIVRYFWPKCPTMEFIQSFLVFFYGATNVFLEHLGSSDGTWSHKDLQHVSIAFMFFGGGLCGLVLESETITSLIQRAFSLLSLDSLNSNEHSVRRGWSRNPMPAFIVFWTGALMSNHEQETTLSTQIHIQWGTMLSLAGVFRLLTIFLLIVKPRPSNVCEAEYPQRPFTEIIVSFFLVCGGMIFMSSNRESVEAMIYRGMDQMFTLNVSVGVTVLMMAYFVGCIALKGWVSSRY